MLHCQTTLCKNKVWDFFWLTFVGDMKCILSIASRRFGHEANIIINQRNVQRLLPLYSGRPVVFNKAGNNCQKIIRMVAISRLHREHDKDVIITCHVYLWTTCCVLSAFSLKWVNPNYDLFCLYLLILCCSNNNKKTTLRVNNITAGCITLKVDQMSFHLITVPGL